eukprot:1984465-Ditylum_brightwellii.AAC.1
MKRVIPPGGQLLQSLSREVNIEPNMQSTGKTVYRLYKPKKPLIPILGRAENDPAALEGHLTCYFLTCITNSTKMLDMNP